MLFALLIAAALWILQTVFLQAFYNRMAIHTVQQAAATIAAAPTAAARMNAIDREALEASLLIFLSDPTGVVLYSSDEHQAIYQQTYRQEQTEQQQQHETEHEVEHETEHQTEHETEQESGHETPQETPYTGQHGHTQRSRHRASHTRSGFADKPTEHFALSLLSNTEPTSDSSGLPALPPALSESSEGETNWPTGVYRALPSDNTQLLEQLSVSGETERGYITEDGNTYIYGRRLLSLGEGGATAEGNAITGGNPTDEVFLSLSMPLGAVGATVRILRVQLVGVTAASLIIGFIIAYFIARQFARPIRAITAQAGRMAQGDFPIHYTPGFCQELDELSDTLNHTATALEQAERDRQQLEQDRRQLLANISHDLRTPLTMIKGYAEMVREISWNDDTRREQDLSIIIREADRLTALVNDILNFTAASQPNGSASAPAESFSPPSTQGATTTYPLVPLSQAAQFVVEQFTPLCEQHPCTLRTAIAPNQWVAGDEKQLQRVLYNLLDNAMQHTQSGGVVQVMVQAVERVTEPPVVRVEVHNDGAGIPPDELPHIWDRYFTEKREATAHRQHGLGLAIVKEILVQQHAQFGVASNPGQGCTFWFELQQQQPGAVSSVPI